MKEFQNMTDQEIKELQEKVKKELVEREEKRKEYQEREESVRRKLEEVSKRYDVLSKNTKLIGNTFEETHKDNSKTAYYVTGIDGLYIIVDMITKNANGTKFVKEHKKLALIPNWKQISFNEYKQYLVEESRFEKKIEKEVEDTLNTFSFRNFSFPFGGFFF